ncbi:MAG: dephospho-CoA kinase [Proteobacteria bacterium]|nr:dephospho-CoA kinase [Pseudomonadota bacterium]
MQTPSPLIIGVTGCIGSGKSAVGALLAQYGATVIDADELAREVVTPGSPGLAEVVAHFGTDILESSSGKLNRHKLATIVFANPSERKALERMLHPRIRALFAEKLAAAKAAVNPPWLIAYLVPLLFESGYSYDELDLKVVVSATEQVCIERIVRRDTVPPELARKRLAAQLPIKEKEARADFVIHNNGSMAELQGEVKRLFDWLQERHQRA